MGHERHRFWLQDSIHYRRSVFWKESVNPSCTMICDWFYDQVPFWTTYSGQTLPSWTLKHAVQRRLASCFGYIVDHHTYNKNPGVWLSRDKTHNVIVMDVEGSDGGSRGDDQVNLTLATTMRGFFKRLSHRNSSENLPRLRWPAQDSLSSTCGRIKWAYTTGRIWDCWKSFLRSISLCMGIWIDCTWNLFHS
jgi:hypothetical protein